MNSRPPNRLLRYLLSHPGQVLSRAQILEAVWQYDFGGDTLVVEHFELPRTRPGRIMRRFLRGVAENRAVGDVTTLADSSVMDLIQT